MHHNSSLVLSLLLLLLLLPPPIFSSKGDSFPFVWKRLSKCGSTAGGKWAHRTIRMRALLDIDEQTPLTMKYRNGEKYFVVGSTRNPCSYYVSLWSYTSKKPWFEGKAEAYEKRTGKSIVPNTNYTNKDAFHNFLDEIVREDFGLMTARWLETLIVRNSHHLTCYSGRVLDCINSPRFHDFGILKHNFTSDIANCWVYLEDFGEDFQKCLVKYEELRAKKGLESTVNWEKLKTLQRRNKSVHERCEYYYEGERGERMKEKVMKADSMIFEEFGYESCCGGPGSLGKH